MTDASPLPDAAPTSAVSVRPDPRADRVAAIIGLGLIGGSLARDLAARGVRVLGHDRDPGTVVRAIDEGVVAAPIDADFASLALADWVVLAVPVDAAPALLATVAPGIGSARLVTDVGSTKRGIVTAAERLRLHATFVGSHPFAGDHASGWDASRAGLFEGATVFICPTGPQGSDDADVRADAAERTLRDAAADEARLMWSLCGAQTRRIGAAEHDHLLARTSHLPQLLSTALAALLAAEHVPCTETGPGARGMLRLAGSSPEMWSAIAADNRDNLTDALSALERILAELRDSIAHDDADAVRALLAAGRRYVES